MTHGLALLLCLPFKVFGRLVTIVITTVVVSGIVVALAALSSVIEPAETTPDPHPVREQAPALLGGKAPCSSS